MNCEDSMHIRNRLLFLGERAKKFHKQSSTVNPPYTQVQHKPKLSVQDFVRMDPGYTPDIEHLVFPGRKRNNHQQVAPLNSGSSATSSAATSNARSRLAEMFALSKHLQQRSQDRQKSRSAAALNAVKINRSVDSTLESRLGGANTESQSLAASNVRRWVVSTSSGTMEEPVRSGGSSRRTSPVAEPAMAAARDHNVSVMHLGPAADLWENSTSGYSTTRSSSSQRIIKQPPLSKHQSLGSRHNKWSTSPNFHSTSNDSEMFVSINRELSPVRWCDREVDGVYLNRSGWVQVQQRSLDDSRKSGYAATSSLHPSKRTGIKLADYHCNSVPAVRKENENVYKKKQFDTEANNVLRPGHLLLQQSRDIPQKIALVTQPNSFSPPSSLTPIISPPPAFQDRNNKTVRKERKFFGGKPPFLPRCNAIVDSDEVSPPPTPTPKWVNAKINRILQTKSMEDHYSHPKINHQSPSSTPLSSMGFRSLDSNYISRPRFSETTDSSIEVYEDADDEDNNSSSINMNLKPPPPSIFQTDKKEKNLPLTRHQNRTLHRPLKRSPVGSDKGPTSPGSSSSSSNERSNLKSTPGSAQQIRKTSPVWPTKNLGDTNMQRVRRSKSFQLPDRNKRILPQPNVSKNQEINFTDEDMIREAEVVAGFLYGNRSRAAAQALLMHRFNNNTVMANKNNKDNQADSKLGSNQNAQNAELTVYFVNGKKNQKILHRGMTTPNPDPHPDASSTQSHQVKSSSSNVDSCHFLTHCSLLNTLMRSSQTYPNHQRSLDSASTKRLMQDPEDQICRTSPTSLLEYEKKSSPVASQFVSSLSSNSDVWLPDRTLAKKEVLFKAESVLTRPESAPIIERGVSEVKRTNIGFLESQHRSMSLPKSFLSGDGVPQKHLQGGHQFSWNRNDSLTFQSDFERNINRSPNKKKVHTAPVTPLHEGSHRPLDVNVSKGKAISTPELIETPSKSKWAEKNDLNELSITHANKDFARSNLPRNATDSVLQKFRKTFSLRFYQKKQSKDGSTDLTKILSEESIEDQLKTEKTSPEQVPKFLAMTAKQSQESLQMDRQPEQKNRFGTLKWRTSKEKRSLNKATRNTKCNSGDSGIQIENVPDECGTLDTLELSETVATPSDATYSLPSIRNETPIYHQSSSKIASRPHSDLFNQIIIDKFKSDIKQKKPVRRTRSDLGGHRLLSHTIDPLFHSTYRRMMSSPVNKYLQNPYKKSLDDKATISDAKMNDSDEDVQLRPNRQRCGKLRRSLSQPLDIGKLSPLMRTKRAGLRLGRSSGMSEDEHDPRTTSDDDTNFDSESSQSSFYHQRKKMDPTAKRLIATQKNIFLAEAVFNHVAIEAEELGFRAGDVIEVMETDNRDWWWGRTPSATGWFPSQFVRLRVSQEDTVEDCLAAGHVASSQLRRRTSVSLLSNDQVRASVVRELVHTERDFVKVLRDVADGYIAECRNRVDLFTGEDIETIFINLEEILAFQEAFLKDLQSDIVWDALHQSCVGWCFLKHSDGFKIYSNYCNSHTMATAALQELYQFIDYCKFFEACRLMRGLIEIPLDGYLLTPVQRICKYPLQLAELLKYTKPDHRDYNDIKEALVVMRDVAVLINERKRRMESLEKLAAWQQRVEAWEGEDLIEVSSQLIYQGEVVRVTSAMWTSNITLFLLDHQIIYCKKDILKRNIFIYKGRICLDTSEVVNVFDGKDNHLGVNVRHAIRLHSCISDKWLLFCCRSASEKERWLHAFAEERKLVAQDKNDELELPFAARELARMTARCQKRPPRKPLATKNSYKRTPYMGSTPQLNSNSLGKKMGTWFTFGGNKKSRHHQLRDHDS